MVTTPPGYFNAATQFTLAGFARPAFITYGLFTAAASDPQQLADDAQDAIRSSLGARIAATVTIGPTTVRGGTAADPVVAESIATKNGVGSRVTNSPTPQVAVLVKKGTSRGGKRGRGRLFIPWAVGEADVGENGNLSPSEVTTINTSLAAWLNALIADSIQMVVLHSPGISAEGPPNTVDTLTTDGRVGTQHRRMDR